MFLVNRKPNLWKLDERLSLDAPLNLESTTSTQIQTWFLSRSSRIELFNSPKDNWSDIWCHTMHIQCCIHYSRKLIANCSSMWGVGIPVTKLTTHGVRCVPLLQSRLGLNEWNQTVTWNWSISSSNSLSLSVFIHVLYIYIYIYMFNFSYAIELCLYYETRFPDGLCCTGKKWNKPAKRPRNSATTLFCSAFEKVMATLAFTGDHQSPRTLQVYCPLPCPFPINHGAPSGICFYGVIH